MKQFNMKFFAMVVLSIALLSRCGSVKMPEKYDVTPKVLETHGGKVSVAIKAQVQTKAIPKKVKIEATPYLKYAGKTLDLKTKTIKGEKAEGDGDVIKNKEGGEITYSDQFNYTPEMKVAELWLKVKAVKGKKSKDLPEVKLADGIIYTSTRVDGDGKVELADNGYQKETILSKSANIYFAYNKHDLNLSLALNKNKANKAIIDSLEMFINNGWKIKDISINAWASPEGEQSINENLSKDRGKTTNTYVLDILKKLSKVKKSKVAIKDPTKDVTFNVTPKGEDFDGFMKALNASNIKDKHAIENVITSQLSKAQREKRIRDMTVIYQEVEDMLSVLRRGEIVVNCSEPKKTDEQIANLSTSHPDSLDVKELLYAATLTQDLNIKAKVYKSAITVYPNNWKAYNNAGYVSILQGNIDDAVSNLEKANQLDPNNGQVLNNLGICALYKKDYAKAESNFQAAQGQGIDEKYNLGILSITKGDYAAAVSSFAGEKCKYNIALAQLLNGTAEAASATLDCATKTAAVYYLAAVVGARTGNDNMVFNNLKKAIQADAKYREEAKIDREFLKYFANAEFQNAIK